MPMTMQQSLERFVHLHYDSNRRQGQVAESCANLLSDYLQSWSGLLFYGGVGGDDVEPQEWERDLDDKMVQMLQGDTTPPMADLGSLSCDQMDEEHLREFVGWYLLKDMALDSRMLTGVLGMLQQWVDFSLRQRALSKEQHRLFTEVLQETAPDAERATVAAHALQRMVLSGCFHQRQAAASGEVAGLFSVTARMREADREEPCSHALVVDGDDMGQLFIDIPPSLHPYIQPGDVLQAGLLQYDHGGVCLVETGAMFPASTWVDAVLIDRFAPVDTLAEQPWGSLSGDLLH